MEIEDIGIIGTGDMGRRYAELFARTGRQVYCCDLPEKRMQLEESLGRIPNIHILDDGVAVSRRSDLIFYLVPVENVKETVARYGPSTRKGAIVSSGTSVMTPAVEAFQRYLPSDIDIVNWHWLFGPTIPDEDLPKQSSAVINQRSQGNVYQATLDAFNSVKGPQIIELPSYQEHDRITADTQAVTQVGFEAMGTAWKNMGSFPWENPIYVGGIDNVKVLMCLRIYGGKSHVYAGLSIHNPFAREQIGQYKKSVSDLFGLMIQEDEQHFRERINRAKDSVFGNGNFPILLDDSVMGEFSLGSPSSQRMPNSHLSLLSMADAWSQMRVNPYDNLICQTPPFRLRLGIVEYLFRHPDLLEESLETALHNKGIRRDDLEFQTAVREWSTVIGHGDTNGYHRQFAETREFFPQEKLVEGMRRSGELIRRLSG